MKKKIYKNVISVTILSEEPLIDYTGITDLNILLNGCIYGDYIGGNVTYTEENKELSGKRAVEEIEKLGSDTEFFQMDGSGNDISEVEFNDEHYIYDAE